jgi:hypothetical protein
MWEMQLGPRKAMLVAAEAEAGAGVGVAVVGGVAVGVGVGGGSNNGSDIKTGFSTQSTQYDDGGNKGKRISIKSTLYNSNKNIENANNSSSSTYSSTYSSSRSSYDGNSYDGNIIKNSEKPSNSFNLELGAINNV